MRSGAKLIHTSSNSSGTLYQIENYVGLRIESIRKKMQKAVLKQGIQINTMQIVGVRIVMCATLQSLFVVAHAPDLFKPAQ